MTKGCIPPYIINILKSNKRPLIGKWMQKESIYRECGYFQMTRTLAIQSIRMKVQSLIKLVQRIVEINTQEGVGIPLIFFRGFEYFSLSARLWMIVQIYKKLQSSSATKILLQISLRKIFINLLKMTNNSPEEEIDYSSMFLQSR